MRKYKLYNGKVTFGSALAREAYVLLGNIRDMNYCLHNNKKLLETINSTDVSIMEHIIKSMTKSHKRMVREMVKTGEFLGDPKKINYK